MERNLTTGSVLKNLMFFSLPYLLSYFLQTLYGMADLFIVGQFDSGKPGYAYAYRYDRGTGYGDNRYHWTGSGSEK